MSCELIPKKRGTQEDSQLFIDALNITKSRDKAESIWAIAQDDETMENLGIKPKKLKARKGNSNSTNSSQIDDIYKDDKERELYEEINDAIEQDDKDYALGEGMYDVEETEEEPSVIEIIDALENSEDKGKILTEESYPRYVAMKEHTNKSYDSIDEAFNKVYDIDSKHKEVTSIIETIGNKFKVRVLENSNKSKAIKAKQLSLRELNKSLIDYLEDLGFAVKTTPNIETAGMFSPLDADKNAKGLIEVIQIAKGKLGQRALPEEFSHVLVEGMRNHPILQQLFKVLDNDEVLNNLLADEYDDYHDKYEGNREALIHEVAAKLVAQSIVDSYVENADVNYLANRAIKSIKSNLANGSEEYVQNLIDEAQKLVEEFINLDEDERVQFFDVDAVMNSKKMFNLVKNMESMEQLSKKSYELMNKRLKILSLGKKNQTLTPEQYKSLDKVKEYIDKKDYKESCIAFLKYVATDIQDLYESVEKHKQIIGNSRKYYDPTSKRGAEIRSACIDLRKAESILVAYTDVVEQLAALNSIEELKKEFDIEEDIDTIVESAREVSNALKDLKAVYTDARMNTLWNFYQEFWGRDKIFKTSNGENQLITLEDILQGTVGDIGFSRQINAMCDLSDPFLQLVDFTYKNCSKDRDEKIYILQQRIAAITQEYIKATGSRDTSFMYERDENGKPTGYLKSEYDFAKYRKDRHDYYLSIKGKYSKEEISAKLKEWDNQNTEYVIVNKYRNTKKRLPKLSKYSSSALNSLTPAQKVYYDKMMDIKEELDAIIPQARVNKYLAVQKKSSIADSVMEGKATSKSIFKRFKDKFIRDVSDTDYGELNGTKQVILDFAQKEVRRVPVYYTSRLEDMSQLELSMSDALMSYGAMAYNYSTMNAIADAMELTASLAADRNIVKTSGGKKLVEFFGFNGEKFGNDYIIKGSQSGSYTKLMNYLDANVFGKRKNLQTARIGNSEIDLGKTGDTLKSYSTLVGLGYNLFSGVTNLNMGIAQTIIQSVGGEYFGFKNIAKANKNYFKDVAGAVADQYSDFKDNKLGLLIQKFDALEEFSQSFNDTNFHSGVFKKMIGQHSPLVLNSMGEHYLHSITMLAVLDKTKVKLNGKEVSLYDALKVSTLKTKDGYEYQTITIADGTKKLDGSDFTEDDLFQVRRVIQDANHRMHGAFNETDRGDIHRHVIGRLAMQFRQWMPAFYSERFKSKRLNIVTGETEEGFYLSLAKFLFGVTADSKVLCFNYGTKWKNLSKEDKKNLKKATTEIAMLWLMLALIGISGGPDKDDPWVVSMMKYNMYRLKMELGAAAPTSLGFLDNIKTLVQSPIPCMESTDKLISLVKLTDIGETIQSGKYAGWNKWLRNAYFATPYVKNIVRVFDLAEGDISIFNPYTKQR